jgi:NAD(P)H-dependent FMN reductase
VIAEQAAHLTVFQRTPNFSIPTRNKPMDDEYEQSWKTGYAEKRREARRTRTGILNRQSPLLAMETSPEERQKIYEARWETGGTSFMGSFADLIMVKEANDTAADFVRAKIREMVKDPKVAELRELSLWSEGQVWVSPERHGAITGVMKCQIDWIPLSVGAVRPTQGRTLAVMQVSGGSQSFNAVNTLRLLGRWMRMVTIPNQSSVAKAYQERISQARNTDQVTKVI